MAPQYKFKPSFLDRMTSLQRQSWLQAAEEVMQDQGIVFQRALVKGRVEYLLKCEKDYKELCELSMDIGERALRIEANKVQDNRLTLDSDVAGHA